jgi:ATP-binding cassette subfamily F protein 3
MLTLSEISKAYGGRILFADAALQVNRADRIGLVGPNGAGKTTLFSIILGTESADSGDLTRERGITIGYLPQESAPTGDETVIELATAVTPDFVKLRRVIKAWEADHPAEALHAEEIHDNAHDRYHELGGYRLEARAKQILAGLGFRERDFERPARELSDAGPPRAAPGAGTGFVDARRADESPRPRSVALAPGLFAALSRRHRRHFARP